MNRFQPVGLAFISEQQDDLMSATRVLPGDVLLNITGASIGRVCVVPTEICPANVNQHVSIIRSDSSIDPKYLAFYIASPEFQAFIIGSQAGATRQALTKAMIEDFRIPLAPLPEQQRIAALLTEQLAAVERARAATQAQLDAARSLPSACLRDVFTGPEAQQWSRQRLGDWCALLPAKSIATDGDTEVITITTACLTESGFSSAGLKTARMWSNDVKAASVVSGEILIARSNTSELVGRVSLYEGSPPGIVASDLVIRLLARPPLSATFLTTYLSHLYLTGYWRDRAGGASGSMKKITRSQLQEEQIPIPAAPVQQRVISLLIGKIEGSRQVTGELQEQLAAVDQLPAALLRRAFSGELSTRHVIVTVPTISAALRTETTEEQRAAILAYIVHYNRNKPDLYRTILAKDLYLAEAHAGVPKGGEYLRLAAGPFATDLSRLERVAAEQKWFRKLGHKRKGRDMVWSYRPGTKIDEALEAAKSVAGDSLITLNDLLDLLASQNTWHTEMIATLFAAWNDFVLEGKEPTEEQIVREVRENWHPKKEKFSPGSLHEKLAWMREHGLVPRGLGPHTKSASEPTRDGSL